MDQTNVMNSEFSERVTYNYRLWATRFGESCSIFSPDAPGNQIFRRFFQSKPLEFPVDSGNYRVRKRNWPPSPKKVHVILSHFWGVEIFEVRGPIPLPHPVVCFCDDNFAPSKNGHDFIYSSHNLKFLQPSPSITKKFGELNSRTNFWENHHYFATYESQSSFRRKSFYNDPLEIPLPNWI